jgi:23S rRNA pseudouridine1911/1915/1917 synthase
MGARPPGGLRLDVALIRRFPDLSRRRARDVIEKGQVSVDGTVARLPGMMVTEAAALAWDPNRKALPRARASLPILWSDDALVIVDKPAGLLAVASAPGSEEDTAVRRMHDYARHLDPRRPYVGVVHRLDRDTSGALAFALTPPAREALRALFRAHRIERRYVALVHGRPPGERGEIDLPIHQAYVAGRRRVARDGEDALPALTRWRVLERFADAALLELELETGRQHQIRLHLAHAGLPVMGDPVYAEVADRARRQPARRLRLAVPRQMLHAHVLGLTHPLTGQLVRVESPLPPDFSAALARLRRSRPRP